MKNSEKLAVIERELRRRYKEYPKLVDAQRMSEKKSKHEIEALEDVAADYRALVEGEDKDAAAR